MLCNIFAQNDSIVEPPFNIKRELKIAQKHLNKGNIYEAADIYKEIVKYEPDRIDVIFELAEAYRISRDYENAAIWYLKTDSINSEEFPLCTYYAGLMLKMTGRCDMSIGYFERFYKKPAGDFPVHFRKWAKAEIDGCKLAEQLSKKPVDTKIIHLDSTINSPYTDISPFLWNDSTLVFASLPSDSVIIIENQATELDYYIKFYESTIHEESYSKPKIFPYFNEKNVHTVNGTFSPDHKRFYFTKCYEGFNGIPVCSIFESKLFKGEWLMARALPSHINPGNSNSTQPTIGLHPNGKEILYFVSDRLESEGGKDIWFCEIKSNGEYGEAVNAGSLLNTDRDEATPYFDNKTQTLYFSSNGHPGIGGYDIFMTKGETFRWDKPKNMGYPLNSFTDDMYYRLNENNSTMGYMVSNRPGIISIRNETCCDDIFEFEHFDPGILYIKGLVYNDKEDIKERIEDANVKLVLLSSSDTGSIKDTIIKTIKTNGKQAYIFQIKEDLNYKVIIEKDDYLSSSISIDNSSAEGDSIYTNVYLKRLEKDKAYSLNNIYYDYDKWELNEGSKRNLDTLYNIMIDNPQIIVEIGSHTDTRGSDSYNYKLSQKRAESCVQYLIDKGISMGKLLARGYGESHLIREDCNGLEDCMKEENGDCPCHQQNRRTEFKIVGEIE